MAYPKKCEVCGRKLVEEDGYLSCPVYIKGKNKEADEHTSIHCNKGEC